MLAFYRGPSAARRHGAWLAALVAAVLLASSSAQAAAVVPNDPKFSSQYGPQLVAAPTAWSTTMGSGSATICLLDTGVRRTHEDLAAHYAGGIDFVNGDLDPWDDRGHGTKVAGVAAAVIGNGKGIAGIANVPFQSVKVIDGNGAVKGDAIVKGIRWCVDNGAKIISMSFAGPGADPAVQDAVADAWSRGLLLVAGAGNGGCDNCVLYPAAFEQVIAVGCVDSTGAVCAAQSKGPQLELAAPGVNVLTTGYGSDGAYTYGGGSSMSAPHVAGVAALVWSAHPEYTNVQVRSALQTTAQDLGPAGRDAASGFGLVRADRAVQGSGSTSTTSPAASTSGAFAATFTPSPNVNEWWVEVHVSANADLARVDAQANGGSWQTLSKTDWGTWAKSFNVPKGSSVVFRATSTAAATSTSAPIVWMGTSTTTPTPTPTPVAFTATFTPSPNVNEWWVDVKVSASSAVARVEAQANGGAWQTLSKTEWGTWAKSFNVPKGSSVVFKATSTTGATSTSAPFAWLEQASSTVSPPPQAVFTAKAVGNDWWVEVAVDSPERVTKVEAREDAGPWIDLPKTTWGTWAKSIHVEDGHRVEFRAALESGTTATSATYVWT